MRSEPRAGGPRTSLGAVSPRARARGPGLARGRPATGGTEGSASPSALEVAMRTRKFPALFTLAAMLAGLVAFPGCGGGGEVAGAGIVVIDEPVLAAPPRDGGTHYVPPDGDEFPPP